MKLAWLPKKERSLFQGILHSVRSRKVLALGSLKRGWENKRGHRMNIVIQQIDTRQFLAHEQEWVADSHEALTFNDTRQALQYCRRHALRNVRLVVFFRDNKVSLLLYVPGSKAPAPAGVLHSAA
jgi:hypothetical protein